MGDTTKMIIQVARFLVAVGAGAVLAYEWAEFRPIDRDNWLMLAGVGLVAMVIVFVLMRKLANKGSD